MNLKSLTVLMMLLFGPVVGSAVAHAHKAGGVGIVLFAISGLLVAFGLAAIYDKFAFTFLHQKPASVGCILYMLFSFVGILAVPLVMCLFGLIIYG